VSRCVMSVLVVEAGLAGIEKTVLAVQTLQELLVKGARSMLQNVWNDEKVFTRAWIQGHRH